MMRSKVKRPRCRRPRRAFASTWLSARSEEVYLHPKIPRRLENTGMWTIGLFSYKSYYWICSVIIQIVLLDLLRNHKSMPNAPGPRRLHHARQQGVHRAGHHRGPAVRVAPTAEAPEATSPYRE